jgi:DNA invertase Pin-like site-specific DNA recombinase
MSKDKTGEALGIARQTALCQEKGTGLGGKIVEIYPDNDRSASTGRKREHYLRMIDDIRSGRINGVIVYDLDRLNRSPRELEDFLDLADEFQVALASVGGDVDLATDNGRLYARIKAAVARAEVERKSARQKAALRQKAMMGRRFNSRRAFGYADKTMQVVPEEAAAIREGAQWLLDGVTLAEVARRWNRAGLRTRSDREWSAEAVSQLYRNPRIAGVRTYLREIVVIDGEPVKAEWAAIIDLETWQAVHGLMSDPRRRWPPASAQLLLSGVARCGRCGGRINSGGRRQGNAKVAPRYRCMTDASHINRTAGPVDRFVVDVLFARLSDREYAEDLAQPERKTDIGALRSEAREIHQRMDGLSESYADGLITIGQLKAGTERLKVKLATVESQMVETRRPATVKFLMSDVLDAMWNELDRSTQRAVLSDLMTIRLFGPGQGIRYVTDDHVVIDWLD